MAGRSSFGRTQGRAVMRAPARRAEWREVKRRPIQGNSPDDQILHGPDCNRPKRVCADSFPGTPPPDCPEDEELSGVRFSRHAESIGPMDRSNLGVGCRLPLVGSQAPVKERDGRCAPCSSSAMSSRAGYSLAGCSPAEPASASPTAASMRWGPTAGNELSANGNLSLVSVSQPRGSLQLLQPRCWRSSAWAGAVPALPPRR